MSLAAILLTNQVVSSIAQVCQINLQVRKDEGKNKMTTNDDTQLPDQPPSPDPEHQRLSPLLGTWDMEGQSVDTLAGPAGKVTGAETFEWLRGGYFLVSHYRIVWTEGGAPNYGVMYWGYDSSAKKFQTHFFNDQGPYEEAGSTYEGVIADDKFTFTGPARFPYELDSDGKIKVNPEGTIPVVWWLRDAEVAWQFWRNATYTKIKANA
jgi:hypothetical protein